MFETFKWRNTLWFCVIEKWDYDRQFSGFDSSVLNPSSHKKIVNNDDMNTWRRSRRTLYNAKSQISGIVHNARMISRFKSYFNFGLVKLFLDIKAVSLTYFSVLKSYD